jgi:hypothetical protein
LILFGFLSQSSKTKAVAAMSSVAQTRAAGPGDTPPRRGDLAWFRQEFYRSLTARADALFELTDAVLCADGPVRSLVDLTLVAEHRRGHGAMYDALGHGRLEPPRLRRTLASLPPPRTADGRIVLAVDVSPWLRSDASTSAGRLFCHVQRSVADEHRPCPGPRVHVARQRTAVDKHHGRPGLIPGARGRVHVDEIPLDPLRRPYIAEERRLLKSSHGWHPTRAALRLPSSSTTSTARPPRSRPERTPSPSAGPRTRRTSPGQSLWCGC